MTQMLRSTREEVPPEAPLSDDECINLVANLILDFLNEEQEQLGKEAT